MNSLWKLRRVKGRLKLVKALEGKERGICSLVVKLKEVNKRDIEKKQKLSQSKGKNNK